MKKNENKPTVNELIPVFERFGTAPYPSQTGGKEMQW